MCIEKGRYNQPVFLIIFNTIAVYSIIWIIVYFPFTNIFLWDERASAYIHGHEWMGRWSRGTIPLILNMNSVNSFTSAEVNGLQRGCSVITYFCRRDLDEESGQYVSPFFSLFFFHGSKGKSKWSNIISALLSFFLKNLKCCLWEGVVC